MKRSTLFFILLSVVACSKVKEFEQKTTSMEKTTAQMSTTTEDMKSTTTTMYQQIRSKEAEATRDDKFDEVLDERNEMGTKLAAASVYFKSFEFQLLTNNSFDTKKVRQSMYLDAANEFTRRLSDLYKDVNVKKMSPTNEGRRHNSEMAFYALAAKMHMTHHSQDELSDKTGKEKVSFYDLVKAALQKDKEGKNLEQHEEILLAGVNREIMVELLKARVDMLSALALRNLTDKRNMTLTQKTKAIIFKITGGRLGSIDLPETYSTANEATKVVTERYLDDAVRARTFLVQLGHKKQLEKVLRSAYEQIDLSEPVQFKSIEVDPHLIKIRSLIQELQN